MNRRGFLTASVAIAALPLPATAFAQLPALDAYEATAQRLWQTMKDAAAELFRRGAPGTDAESQRILVNGVASMKAMRGFKELPLETQLHPAVQQVMQSLSARLGESLVFVRAVMEEIAAGGRPSEGDEVVVSMAMDESDPLLADWAPRRADRRAIRRFQRSMTSEQRADAAGRVAARLRKLESRATWQPSSLETTDLDPATMRRVQRARAKWANHPRSSKTLLGVGATDGQADTSDGDRQDRKKDRQRRRQDAKERLSEGYRDSPPAFQALLCLIGIVAAGHLIVLGAFATLFGIGGFIAGFALFLLPLGILGLLMLWGGLWLGRACIRGLFHLSDARRHAGRSTPPEDRQLLIASPARIHGEPA